MMVSIYDAIFDWLFHNDLVILELPKGGYIQNVNGWLQVFDDDGNYKTTCSLTTENLRKLLK